MQALQLYYTSCRNGLSPGTGFQIRAATPGLDPEDSEQIIRLGLHKPPYNGDLSPEACPVAFRVFTLNSGHRVLQRSQYLGIDYSSRQGNFFTHSLIVDEPLPLWAVEYYEWPSWRRCLAPGEDESPPAPLAPVSINGIPPAESFSYEELSLFLQEHPHRQICLAAMVHALFLPPEQRKTLLIRDEKENNPFWIACITRLLPRSVALGLNISTYQHDPLPGLHLMATVPGTAIDVANPALRQSCHIFDLLNPLDLVKNVADKDNLTARSSYAHCLTRLLLEAPAQVEAFTRYTEQFQCTTPSSDLIHAYRLFQGLSVPDSASTGSGTTGAGITGAGITGAGITGADNATNGINIILFATRHAKDQYMAEVLRSTWPFFVTLDPAVYRKSYHTLLGYLLRFCPFETPDEQASLRRILCGALNLCLQTVLKVPFETSDQVSSDQVSSVDDASQRLEQLLSTAAEVLDRLPQLTGSILATLWHGLDQQAVQSALQRLPPTPALALLRFLHLCLAQGCGMPHKSLWSDSPLTALGACFAGADPQRLEALLRLMPVAERAGWVLALQADTHMPLPMGVALQRLHATTNFFEAATFRAALDVAGAYRILLAEFRAMLDKAQDKKHCYDTYMVEVAPTLPHLVGGRRAAWLHELLQSLTTVPQQRNEAALVRLPALPPQAYASRAPQWLQWANEACAFTLHPLPEFPDKARFTLMASLTSAAAALELKLLPHYPALWRVCAIMRTGHPVDDNALVLCAAGFHFMDSREYTAFLQRVMPLLAQQPRSRVAACLRLFHHHRHASEYAEHLTRIMTPHLAPHSKTGTTRPDPYAVPGAVFQLVVMEYETVAEDFTPPVREAAMRALQRLLDPDACQYDPLFYARCLEKLQTTTDPLIKQLWAQLTPPQKKTESFIRAMHRLWNKKT